MVYEARLSVIGGLSHMTTTRGSVHVIHNVDRPSIPELVTLLPDEPMLTYLNTTSVAYAKLVIIGSHGVMAVGPLSDTGATELEILAWVDMFHWPVTPTSMVRVDDHYFIGLPHGVAVLPTASYTREHLTFYSDTELTNCPHR